MRSSTAVLDCLLLTLDKLRETLNEMHWKVVAEKEVMDVRSAFTRVNLTEGTFQKVVTKILIQWMFIDLEVLFLHSSILQ